MERKTKIKKRNPIPNLNFKFMQIYRNFFVILCVCLVSQGALVSCFVPPKKPSIQGDSLLSLKINGMITDEVSMEFMNLVRKYIKKDRIKGVLVRVNSPGGTVGASQEIYSTIQWIRTTYKKPVFVSAGGILASGAVYMSMAADRLFVNAGTLFGSIGVIVVFSNLSALHKWMKMDFEVIKSGEFKDSGSVFRSMTDAETQLFKKLLNRTHKQFQESIVEGRGLSREVVSRYSDGRIFTGEEAVMVQLADRIGTFNEAIQELGKVTGLGSSPNLFEPKEPKNFFDYLNINSIARPFQKVMTGGSLIGLTGRPLYILPSYLIPL